MLKEESLVGRRSHKLVIRRLLGFDSSGYRLIECLCDCGNITTFRWGNFRSGNTKSCGCLRTKHAMHDTATYISWEQMKQRCLNPKAPNYRLYGGRGISICDRWLDFQNFYEDMGKRPANKSLDRVDNSGNYSPDNCRWATRSEQQRNKRPFSEWKKSRGALAASPKEGSSCAH